MSFKEKIKGFFSKVKKKVSEFKFTQKHKEIVVFSVIGLLIVGGVTGMYMSFYTALSGGRKPGGTDPTNNPPTFVYISPKNAPILLESENYTFEVETYRF